MKNMWSGVFLKYLKRCFSDARISEARVRVFFLGGARSFVPGVARPDHQGSVWAGLRSAGWSTILAPCTGCIMRSINMAAFRRLWQLMVVLLPCAYLALYLGCFAMVARHWQDEPLLWVLGLPGVWVALELVRAHLLTGFPWVNLGYTQTPCTHAHSGRRHFRSLWRQLVGGAQQHHPDRPADSARGEDSRVSWCWRSVCSERSSTVPGARRAIDDRQTCGDAVDRGRCPGEH